MTLFYYSRVTVTSVNKGKKSHSIKLTCSTERKSYYCFEGAYIDLFLVRCVGIVNLYNRLDRDDPIVVLH